MLELRSPDGSVELELLPEVGGRIHRLRIDGHDVLRTPSDTGEHVREPLLWGSYPMVPWCNRIPDGQLWFGGAMHQQAITLDTFAIHGRAYTAVWQVAADGELTFSDPGDTGFPWSYRARQRFEIDNTGITLELALENTGTTSMPAGLGIHPWFADHGGLAVTLPAELVYPSEGNLPTGSPVPVTGDRDLRLATVPNPGIDECWTGLSAAVIRMHRLADNLRVDYTFSTDATHVVLAALPAYSAIAVEPQTHAVASLGVLEPGRTMSVSYAIQRGPTQITRA